MKKFFVCTVCLALVICMSQLVACSSYGKLQKAFEKEGYKVSETMESIVTTLKKDIENDESGANLHAFSKGLSVVVIIEFSNNDAIKKFYDSSDTVKGLIRDINNNENVQEFYKALEDSGYVKGNCLVVAVNPLYMKDVADIVKNA